MPDASKMDRRVVIQRREVTRDPMGGEIETWPPFATVWAEKRDLRGREYSTAMQAERAEADTTWRLRWLSGVSTTMRLVYGGEAYDIEAVAEVGRRDYLELRTKRAVP